jgi:hypothetical protein
MATIKIEGQTIKGDAVGITDEIANDDELLKAALAPTWPDVRTATITRTGGTDGKELVVSVVKKAGTKGMDDSEVEEQERHDRGKAREEAEAARVRKLEDLALAADDFLRVHYEFDTRPFDEYGAAVSEHVGVLDKALDALGDEISMIRTARRRA